jgi:hypothetical protein
LVPGELAAALGSNQLFICPVEPVRMEVLVTPGPQ